MIAKSHEDGYLLQLIREGNVPAFEELFSKHRKALYIYARTFIKDEAACLELVHDAFVNLWKDRQHLDKIQNCQSYLCVAIKNRALNYVRDKLVRESLIVLEEADEIVMPETAIEKILLNKLLRDAIASLPSASKRILEMRYFQEMSYAEIAQANEISKKTVGSQLNYAIKLLGLRLKNFNPDLELP
ncbi:RNA polymerase sigma factor [Chitinophaga arvensicola]|uniref:RNA polymerase sigma-70 factor, ECF subfamily n=1 Tax=Chitinophaga arvensicola TaxID=29529 RepID=A0A1I0S7K3_9BACT|nr:RNA polymerase sigma-70 factor [Chitinophaga arvensicola]SEW51599.1 RNA polymerase sigma-70 factor, ECF subfamily [Chitinophaga arvensicola]